MIVHSSKNPIVLSEGLFDIFKKKENKYNTKSNTKPNNKPINNNIKKEEPISSIKFPELTPEETEKYTEFFNKMLKDMKNTLNKTINKYKRLKEVGGNEIFTIEDSIEDLINLNLIKTDFNEFIYVYCDPAAVTNKYVNPDEGLSFGSYDIWNHKDLKNGSKTARPSFDNNIWEDDDFNDQLNDFQNEICKNLTNLGYGEVDLDIDWDTGFFDLYHLRSSKKFKEFQNSLNK